MTDFEKIKCPSCNNWKDCHKKSIMKGSMYCQSHLGLVPPIAERLKGSRLLDFFRGK